MARARLRSARFSPSQANGSDISFSASTTRTAVSVMQRTGLDEGEVGHQSAHLGYVLDAADKVRVARLIEKDHRRALGVAVVDDDVDLITR